MSATDGDSTIHARRRRMEIFAFLFLTAVLMPGLAVAAAGVGLTAAASGEPPRLT